MSSCFLKPVMDKSDSRFAMSSKFLPLESFHSLLVFLDELLEFEYYCLLLGAYVSSLCCNRFNGWFTILFVRFRLTCVFLVQIRFQLALS